MTLWHCCQDGGSTPPISTKELMRVREVVTRLAHNQEIGGSIPPPATKMIEYGSNIPYTM